MTDKHTPGPWTRHAERVITDPARGAETSRTIDCGFSGIDRDADIANARLCAAPPPPSPKRRAANMKLADQLKSMSLPNTPAYRAGEMLLECESAISDYRETLLSIKNAMWSELEGSDEEWTAEIDALLAKLRGEA